MWLEKMSAMSAKPVVQKATVGWEDFRNVGVEHLS